MSVTLVEDKERIIQYNTYQLPFAHPSRQEGPAARDQMSIAGFSSELAYVDRVDHHELQVLLEILALQLAGLGQSHPCQIWIHWLDSVTRFLMHFRRDSHGYLGLKGL